MRTKELTVGSGRFAIEAAVTVTAAGIAVVACTSDHDHVGATAQAIPRLEADRTATVSTLAVPCHRDEVPAHDIAAALATRFRVPTVATCGFHIGDATACDIERLLGTTRELIDEIGSYVERLERSCWDRDEDVVTVAPDGAVTGSVSRERAHIGAGILHQAFSTVLVQGTSDQARVMLCRRSSSKRLWAGVLADTCAGHPRPSEDLAAAAARRLREETGLDADAVPLSRLGHIVYCEDHGDGRCECEWCGVFGGVLPDGHDSLSGIGSIFRVNPEEISEVRVVSFSELEAYLEGTPESLAPWLALALREPDIWSGLRALAKIQGPQPRSSSKTDRLPIGFDDVG